MKRINRSVLAGSIIVILFGPIMFYTVRHRGDRGGIDRPKDQAVTVGTEELTPIGPISVQPDRIAARDDCPTLAPPKDASVVPAEPRFERCARGGVIYIPVEAEQAGEEKQ